MKNETSQQWETFAKQAREPVTDGSEFHTGEQTEVVVEDYDKFGEVTSSNIVMARKVVTNRSDSNTTVYKIAIYGGAVYNPSGPYSNREKALRDHISLREVSEKTFNNYVKYLKTREASLLNAASRGFVNHD